MCQPLGVSRIGESCEMQGMLVSRGGDDRVDFAVQRQLDRLFNGVAGDAAGANYPVPVGTALTRAEVPVAYCNPVSAREGINLIAGTDQSNLRLDRLAQCGGRDLRTDPARITERDGKSRRLLRPLRPLYDLIST